MATPTSPASVMAARPGSPDRNEKLPALQRPHTSGWLAEMKAQQATPRGQTPYRPAHTTTTECLTYLNKRAAQQKWHQGEKESSAVYTEAVGVAVDQAKEAATPTTTIVATLEAKLKGVRKQLDFDDTAAVSWSTTAPNYSTTPRSGYRSTISIALQYLNQRAEATTAAKEAEKVATLKAAVDAAEAAAAEQGVPDELLEAELAAVVEQLKTEPPPSPDAE